LLSVSTFNVVRINDEIVVSNQYIDVPKISVFTLRVSRGTFTKEYNILSYLQNSLEHKELIKIPVSDLPSPTGIYKFEFIANLNIISTYYFLHAADLIASIIRAAKEIDLTVLNDEMTSISYNHNKNLAETEAILKAVAILNGVLASILVNDFDAAEELLNKLINISL